MSGPNSYARFARVCLLTATLTSMLGCVPPVLADQKTNQEPVRTTLPIGESTHSSKMMMAPIMSAEERNAVYLQWGLISAALFTAVTALVIWIFLNTRKETADQEEDEQENAYTAATPPISSSETAVSDSAAAVPAHVEAITPSTLASKNGIEPAAASPETSTSDAKQDV